MYVEIDDIKISDPIDDVKTCKRKELTFGGIITGKVKLNDLLVSNGDGYARSLKWWERRINIIGIAQEENKEKTGLVYMLIRNQ